MQRIADLSPCNRCGEKPTVTLQDGAKPYCTIECHLGHHPQRVVKFGKSGDSLTDVVRRACAQWNDNNTDYE